MYWCEESEDWPAWTVVAAAIETAVVVEAAEVELLVVVGVAVVVEAVVVAWVVLAGLAGCQMRWTKVPIAADEPTFRLEGSYCKS